MLHRIHAITYREQFLISYGGLRGAIAFALATSISTNFKNRDVIVTATLFVIFITVFVMVSRAKQIYDYCD
jgi:solute carrier family 9 (sodium/hydrogen exchanger) protein 1